MPRFGFPELIVVLVIVVLLFGIGRVTKIGGEIGGAIRSFRKGLKGNEEDTTDQNKKDQSNS